MMTGKEALEKISTKQVAIELFNIVSNGKYDMNEIVPYFDRIDKALTELEELKKRDTPMKLTQSSRFTTDKKLYGMYACNNCHNVVPYININNKYVKPNFCYRCGQRLDWSDKK